jgi:hypothetical protein
MRIGIIEKLKVFVYAFGAMLLALYSSALARHSTKVPPVGYLSAPPLSVSAARIEAFRQRLRELGYVEGTTYSLSGDLPRENPIVSPPSWPS